MILGLSVNERNRRKRVLDFINKLSPNEVESLHSYNTPVSESVGDKKYINMSTIQSVLDNNTFEKITFGEGMSFSDSVAVISLFFMSNKNVTLAEGSQNVFNIYIERSFNRDEEISFSVNYGFEKNVFSATDFNESPLKFNTKDATMTFDLLVDKCDYNVIYDSMLPLVEKNLKKFDLMAYSLFKSDSLKHLRNFNISTLAVGLHKKTGRYIYHYNPRFILREALEEYVNNGHLYNSLQDCYVYLLTFFIAHEMAHLITNNQVHFSGGNSDVDLDGTYASGGMDNVVMDGFINAKLKVSLSQTPNLTYSASRDGGVFPSNCIKDTIHMRIQHNVGIKKFKNTYDMVSTVVDTLNKVAGLDRVGTINIRKSNDKLDSYWGADAFCNFFVGSAFKELRASSHIFQKVISDVVRVLTKGKIYWSKSGGITDEEKVSDKEILKNGTLVKVKGTNVVGIIKGYKPVKKDEYITLDVYTVNTAKIDRVDVTDLDGGAKLNSPIYVDSGSFYADLDRKYIIPIDGSYGSWVEGMNDEKTSLSEEDLSDDSSMSMGSNDDFGDGGGTQPKSVKVGDIVWISKKKRFGIVTSIVNGSFHVEDVREEPCVVIDDSDNH